MNEFSKKEEPTQAKNQLDKLYRFDPATEEFPISVTYNGAAYSLMKSEKSRAFYGAIVRIKDLMKNKPEVIEVDCDGNVLNETFTADGYPKL